MVSKSSRIGSASLSGLDGPASSSDIDFVRESRIGFWLLGTKTWTRHVLALTLNDLEKLIPERKRSYPVVLDAGCGQGNSFRLLIEHFAPQRVIAIDAEERCIRRAARAAAQAAVPIEVQQRDAASLALPDASVDLIFCHQTFHHLTRQAAALQQFYRVLKPGGLFLFAESTRAYIHSWIIRWLFRHPMSMQRSAEEYLATIREQGFLVGSDNVSRPYLWWSRPDLGALEFFGANYRAQPQATLIYLAAVKPN